MKPLVVAVFFTLVSVPVYSQQNSKLYRAKIILNTGSRTGIVTTFADSAIQIIKVAEAKSGNDKERLTSEWIPVSSIREMRFRKLNALKSGAIGGAAIGLVLGGVIGNVSYQPCDNTPGWLGSECDFEVMDRTASTILGALIGVEIGAGVGILIGASNKKFVVNGNKQSYDNVRPALDKYVMR